jgi:hypothetical protein
MLWDVSSYKGLHINLPFYIEQAKLPSNDTHNFFISIGQPTYQSPSIQARNPIYIGNQRAHCPHQLQPHHRLHIEYLCIQHQEEQEEGNESPILVEELQVNNEVANILLELGDVNEPMSLDKELEEEFVAPQHQVQPYQLTPRCME